MLTLIVCCLVINEIAHAPADPSAEYVELLHTGSARLDLSGATLYDERHVPRLISARPLQLEPGEYLVLVRDGEAFSQAFPGVPFLQVAGWPSLNNDGDRVAIALDGIELDAVAYLAAWGRGPESLERVDPAGPSYHRVNWRPSLSSGTPGQQNSRYAPDSTPPSLIYAEVFHPDSAFVVFSEPVMPAPASAFGGGVVQWQTDSSAFLTQTPFLTDWSPDLNPATLNAFQIQDLFGNSTPATTVEVARAPGVGELVLSERLVRPLANSFDGLPDQVRFTEIWNPSGALLSARGLRLHGRASDAGDQVVTTVQFLPRAVAPGATIVLAENPAAHRSAFSLGSSQDVRVVGSEILRESGLTLIGRRGKVIDRAAYHAAWFDPVLGERGYALSRISEDGLSPLAWAADPLGVSPGVHRHWDSPRHPMPGDVVFSEVLFHARNGQAEFIEFLIRDEADLNGLYVVIDRAPAPPDSVRIVYRPMVLPAGAIVTVILPLSGVAVTDLASHLRSAYPDSEGTLLPLAGSHALRNDGVTMELRSGLGTLLDRVSLHPDHHAADLASVAGISLERVDPDGASSEATNWVSARAAEGATPGRPFSGPSAATLPSGSDARSPRSGALNVQPQVFDPLEGPVTVEFAIQEQAAVQVEVYTRSGRRVRSLLLQAAGGQGRVYWDGRDESGRQVRPGIYLVFVRAPDGAPHKKLVVLARR
jgi:hypothetical protein